MIQNSTTIAAPVQRIVMWRLSHRADPKVVPLADRHYNRQKIGSPQFVPPGSCVVLKTDCLKAFWVTSAPIADYVKHAWAGAWICSAFRNEGVDGIQSSELIRQAVSVTRNQYGEPPELGMITFVDRSKTKHKSPDHVGKCYQEAGFTLLKEKTKGGLYVLQMRPDEMPEPMEPWSDQRTLW
jgi:hypothetical protein